MRVHLVNPSDVSFGEGPPRRPSLPRPAAADESSAVDFKSFFLKKLREAHHSNRSGTPQPITPAI